MKEYTTEELIEALKSQASYISAYEDSKLNEAFKLSIEALEKQIPKEPKVMDKPLRNETFWWYCGHCGASKHTGSRSHYCSYCGGKVDWEGYRNESSV